MLESCASFAVSLAALTFSTTPSFSVVELTAAGEPVASGLAQIMILTM